MSDFKTLLAVGDIADKHVVMIGENNTIYEAAIRMKGENASSLLVTSDNNEITGILTEQDIVRRAVASEMNTKKVKTSEVMTPNPIVIDHTESIFEAKKIMQNQDVHHLIVVNENTPVGILTARNVIGK